MAAVDPRVPFVDLASLRTRTEQRNLEERMLALGATILGAVALVLATAGLHGLFSFVVSLRQREIGVRMALGARPAAVLQLVLWQAMRLALWGSAIGGVTAIAGGAIVNANIFGTPSDRSAHGACLGRHSAARDARRRLHAGLACLAPRSARGAEAGITRDRVTEPAALTYGSGRRYC